MTDERQAERVARFRRLEGVTIADGRFQLERLVAMGSVGAVYRAVQCDLGRPVAVKVVWTVGEGRRARFLREVGALATVTHPNLVVLIDRGQVSERLAYVAMEWLEGRSLSRTVMADGPLPAQQAVGIVRRVVAALGALHAHGIVHRDVKPGNVILGSAGGPDAPVKLVDLDVAHVPAAHKRPGAPTTLPGRLIGTPGFRAPEQERGETVDGRADLWAAGVLLRWLCTGGSESALDGALPPVLTTLVRFATNADREHRPATAAAFLRLLGMAAARLDQEPVLLPVREAATRSFHALRADAPTISVRRARAEAMTQKIHPQKIHPN